MSPTMPVDLETEVLVIGSGAGGAVTAALLSEAGRQVTVVEEGPWIDRSQLEPFSLEEMEATYRGGGLTATLGRPPIAYVEGRCAGGSTEINSGLYHRTPDDVLAEWRTQSGVVDCEPATLAPYAAAIERALSVSPVPGPAPPASAVLARGADRLGWSATEVPRCFLYERPDAPGTKQSMTRTFLPRAREAGARLLTGCRVERLETANGRVLRALCRRIDRGRRPLVIAAEHFVVCGGAVQTPALLQRSGIHHSIGRGLKMHPTAKLVARFDDSLGDQSEVPMHQVKEFAPEITLGGSMSRPGHLAVALGDSWEAHRRAAAEVSSCAVYYAAIRSDGEGRVVALPGLAAPLVTYRLTPGDMSRLARGLVHLAELLFAAGAVEVYPSLAGARPLSHPRDIAGLWDQVNSISASLMTIHLFSSVGMGQDRRRTGADSYGRVWGFDNLRVNDASLLPDAPGVNPQGTVMAIAARNTDHLLANT